MILRCRHCRFERHVPLDLDMLRSYLQLDSDVPQEDIQLHADQMLEPNRRAIDEAVAEIRQHASVIHQDDDPAPAEMILEGEERELWVAAKAYHESKNNE